MILETRDLRRHLLKAVGPLLGITVISYFIYHSLEGDRGLWSYFKLTQKLEMIQGEYKTLNAERLALEEKVKRLRPESIDRDLLEKQVRHLLGYGHPDEIVVFVDGESKE
ncbi:Septum formation initiator family protein [Candidatus Bealeia paramacronuclearis]|uniref:Septum formation initiator family protein n=1 Tax=Candidatus Bealeia paramacronuclearis TaxID=1921001 RepID=A0ABZ2C5S3_9PROT|nr:Septum formation initiator family protein [Candidatus Bealeia paramacronuclearis]